MDELETWVCTNCGNKYHWAQNVCAACYPNRVDYPQIKMAISMTKEPLKDRRKRNGWKSIKHPRTI